MKAMDLGLRVVNEVGKGKFEIEEFMPFMPYEHVISRILGDAEILRPTGVLDVEGNMIYENYIVKIEGTDMLGAKRVYKCVIEYNDSDARFEAREVGRDMKYVHPLSMLRDVCELKIIGNIYQNKELLETNW